MTNLTGNATSPDQHPGLVLSSSGPLWFAAYTSANREKRVAEQLAQRSVEHFLPLYASTRQWKDRKMRLQFPLFPGYVFVRIALPDRLEVLNVPGVAKLVGFNGIPTPLPQEEIDALRISLASGVRVKPHLYLTVGRRVRVKAGPLAGLQGILVKRKNRARFVVSIELITRSMAVEIDEADLEAIGKNNSKLKRSIAVGVPDTSILH
jgi:transcription antitermination factor NusG